MHQEICRRRVEKWQSSEIYGRLLTSQAIWILLVLSACTTYEPRATLLSPAGFDASLSVTVGPADSRSEVENAYGGEVVVWEPEAGFAVLGLERGLRSAQLRTPNPIKTPSPPPKLPLPVSSGET